MTDLTLYGRPIGTVFDLLGKKENDLTYSLGWGLAQSDVLVRSLLEDVLPGEDPGDLLVYSSFGQLGHLQEAALDYGPIFEEIARQGAEAGSCVGLIGRSSPDRPYGVVLKLSIPRIGLDELQQSDET